MYVAWKAGQGGVGKHVQHSHAFACISLHSIAFSCSHQPSLLPAQEHSDLYAEALRDYEVEHVYVRRNLGDHGFALGDSPSDWTAKCVKVSVASSWLHFATRRHRRSMHVCRVES